MRDPERIHVVTKALEECWRLCPDQRFGQLVENIARNYRPDDKEILNKMWNMEEREWLRAIEKFRTDFNLNEQ